MDIAKYKGYKVGELVELTKEYKGQEATVHKGVRFTIISFPPCTTPGKNICFVYGKTYQGNPVRTFVENIKKVKS